MSQTKHCYHLEELGHYVFLKEICTLLQETFKPTWDPEFEGRNRI